MISEFLTLPLDKRLLVRYQSLVQQHMNPSHQLSPAIKQLASTQKNNFATTQAVWRFLNNDKVTLEIVNNPILNLAKSEVCHSNHSYALVAHDWSMISFNHDNKESLKNFRSKLSKGYELQTSLLLDANNGIPIAPVAQSLVHADGVYSTYSEDCLESENHLNSLIHSVDYVEKLNIDKELVHIIDREADSIYHLRQMTESGYHWLIRCKEGHWVTLEGKTKIKITDVANGIVCNAVKSFEHKGKKVTLRVGETNIVITRKAQPKQKDSEGKRVALVEGAPLACRLIVAELLDETGNFVSRWTLLSNVNHEVLCNELAQWYYWRWSIESFFKLIKQAGHAIESWLQTTPKALLRRLLIASMACALVWRIQRMECVEGQEIRNFLCSLSGRVQKRGRRESAPALLMGLSILLNTLQLISEYSIDDLKKLAEQAIGYKGLL